MQESERLRRDRKPLRPMAKVAIAAVILLGVTMIRTLVGIGAAWAFYSDAQPFEEYAASHPVPAALIEDVLPAGTLLAEDEAWSVGGELPEERTELGVFLDARIERGDTLLLAGRIEVVAPARVGEYEPLGYRVDVPELTVGEGMRAYVQVTGRGLVDALETGARPTVWIDVVLATGDGPTVFRVVETDEEPQRFGLDGILASSFMRMTLLGLMHPDEEGPDEGILYRMRGGYDLTWARLERGFSRADLHGIRQAVSSDAYSFALETRVGDFSDDHDGMTVSETIKRTYVWDEDVW